ncbi:TIR domain-containing protein [Saccharopolyspora indica]|uniref:SEFIR domain-containing protein n=1 Tax=Saccharopolyspora indica TaxID=1229659 RepID=UPI0022EB2D34|nr:SEFIR domain-containing protein [Saccharopolyspora indica]MDA3647939.1 TIR domain-containing protein [Saccharopolyspora indica]
MTWLLVKVPSESRDEGEMQLPTAVFISYIHEDEEHRKQVLKFVQLLASMGIDSVNDFWLKPYRHDIGKWAEHYIRASDYTLVIASPRFRLIGDGYGADHENEGGQWEIALLREKLQQARSEWTRRILPVLLPGHTKAEIPDFLQPSGAHHYHVPEITKDGVEKLYRTLTKQQKHVKPELGEPMELPPKSGPGSPGWESGS